MAQPTVTENIGSTMTVNNDAHVRVWTAQIPADGTYTIATDGRVNGYITPRLAFGHPNALGFLVWVFVGMFVAGLVGTFVFSKWLSRSRRKAAAAGVTEAPFFPPPAPVAHVQPSGAYEPSGEGIRLERLKTLAALRDSGALSEAEFETEKRRILADP